LVENSLDAGATSIGMAQQQRNRVILTQIAQMYDSRIRAWIRLRCRITAAVFPRRTTRLSL